VKNFDDIIPFRYGAPEQQRDGVPVGEEKKSPG
jgi:hypothetical protein